jgi:hypothetical protein
MNTQIQLSDVVALTEAIPDRGLLRGQVGTVVESLGPGAFEVEFVDNDQRNGVKRNGVRSREMGSGLAIAHSKGVNFRLMARNYRSVCAS